jgi:hypothetical protein
MAVLIKAEPNATAKNPIRNVMKVPLEPQRCARRFIIMGGRDPANEKGGKRAALSENDM